MTTNKLDQIARDMRDGTFPKKSSQTLYEEAVFKIAMDSLVTNAPGLTIAVKEAIARSIMMKIAAETRRTQ